MSNSSTIFLPSLTCTTLSSYGGNVSSGTFISNNFTSSIKTEKDIADKLQTLIKFRDLKITSVKELENGKIEITLVRKDNTFKIVVDGELILRDEKGEQLEKMGQIKEIYIPQTITTYNPAWVDNTTTIDINDVWTTISDGTTLELSDINNLSSSTIGGNVL